MKHLQFEKVMQLRTVEAQICVCCGERNVVGNVSGLERNSDEFCIWKWCYFIFYDTNCNGEYEIFNIDFHLHFNKFL